MPAAVSADALLTAWEQALNQPAAVGALALLAVARPELDPPARASLSVGARNAALLDLRSAVLGPSLRARADCPECAEPLELELPVDELEQPGVAVGSGPFELVHDGWRLRYRLLCADDLAELARRGEASPIDAAADPDATVAQAGAWLVARCLLAVTPPIDGHEAPDDRTHETDGACGGDPAVDGLSTEGPGADGLPADVVAALAAELARRDPQAELLVALSCPTCDGGWEAELDVPAFVSMELHGWARRLLHEVHLLASAYGWSEPEILRLSPARRRTYLELVLDGSADAGGGA